MNKRFAERLNKELDSIGFPESTSERIEALSKLMHIPKFKAESYLSGLANPELPVLKNLAQELEVSEEWLLGKSDSKARAH